MATERTITRERVREFGVLSSSSSGWTKELNLVRWNDNTPKLDIREWSSDKSRIGKGITLRKEEAVMLRDILNDIDFNEIPETQTKEQTMVA